MSRPLYSVWQGMKRRCQNPRDAKFSNYGGRGIRVCERWSVSFSAFAEDMGPRPSPNHSIDRIDNDGNYEPGNCRWATREEQQNNRGNCRFLTFAGVQATVAEWSRMTGLSEGAIARRLRDGMSVESALTEPLTPRGRRAIALMIKLTVNGESLIIADWARRTGLRRKTIDRRLRAGWTPERAILTPPDSRRLRKVAS